MRIVDTVGEPRTGERLIVFLPDGERDPKQPAVLYCHEHGANAGTAMQPILRKHFDALCAAGIVVAAADLAGPATWGCDEAIAAVDDVWRHLVEVHGVRHDRLSLYGGSMGALTALGWAMRNRSRVARIGLLVPLMDLVCFHRDDPLELAWEIDLAYGGRAQFLEVADSHSPLQSVDALRGLPIRAWYSSNDPMAPPEDVVELINLLGPPSTAVSLGPQGHSPAGLSGAEVLAFFRSSRSDSTGGRTSRVANQLNDAY